MSEIKRYPSFKTILCSNREKEEKEEKEQQQKQRKIPQNLLIKVNNSKNEVVVLNVFLT